MRYKNLVLEDFVNYKIPSLFIGTSLCSFKCEKENNCLCHNRNLIKSKTHILDNEILYNEYANNDITKAIVLGGLEPFDTFDDTYSFIKYVREQNCLDDIIIYTGYNKDEIINSILKLKEFKNIIIKFGRYIDNQQKHYDDVLGVYLASDNQYAERIN